MMPKDNNKDSGDISGLNDEALIVYIRENDKEAYEIIIERYQKKIWYYINRLINNPPEVDDLTQQALVNAYINLNNFNKNKKFSSWLYRIAHNLAVNWLKKKRASFSIENSATIARKLVSRTNISKEILEKEDKKQIETLISNLPLNFKEPLVLKYLEDKSYKEISYILKKPESTIGTTISRAKQILKKELEKI